MSFFKTAAFSLFKDKGLIIRDKLLLSLVPQACGGKDIADETIYVVDMNQAEESYTLEEPKCPCLPEICEEQRRPRLTLMDANPESR